MKADLERFSCDSFGYGVDSTKHEKLPCFVCLFFVVVVVFNISAPLWIVHFTSPKTVKQTSLLFKSSRVFQTEEEKRETNEEGGDVSCCHNYN